MRFVITGTPRSGTQYAARLMAVLGLPCRHEKTLRPLATVADVLKWPTADTGESSWLGWSLVSLMIGYRVPVLQAIRNPWAVIDSLTNRNHILRGWSPRNSGVQGVRETIHAYLPEVMQYEERVDRAASLVIGWNRLIAEHVPARFVFYVDRLDVMTVRAMLEYVGTEVSDGQIKAALNEVSTSANEGYTIDPVPGVSDPDVAQWIRQYAKENDCGLISTLRIRDVAARQTPEELIERMDSTLVDEVNAYAALHGYPTYELAAVA